MENKKIYIFALAAQGEGLSGSDRIFIEFARYWSIENNLNIFVCDDGYRMCLRQKLHKLNIRFDISKINTKKGAGFIGNYYR